MTTSGQPVVAIVSSSAFDFGGENYDPDSSLPLGSDFAKYVEGRLIAHGTSSLSSPVPGEGGWSFDVGFNSGKFGLFVHWAPIGNPPTDRWVIQLRSNESSLESLLGRRDVRLRASDIVSFLQSALATSKEIEGVQWVSNREFALLY